MLRGYRRVIVAAVFGLALSAYQTNLKAKATDPNGNNRVTDVLENIATAHHEQAERAQRPEKTEPCGPDQYGSSAELCAQWKAADAAADSAWWAWAGGIIGLGSLISVLAALGMAFWSNLIARTTARHQLRAYIGITDIAFMPVPPGATEKFIRIMYRNGGETPAYGVRSHLRYAVIVNGDKNYTPPKIPEGGFGPYSRGTLLKGAEDNNRIGVPLSAIPRIKKGDAVIFAYGWIEYTDIFNVKRKTEFRFIHSRDGIIEGNDFLICPEGNNSD